MKTLIAVLLACCLTVGGQGQSASRTKKVPCYSGEVGDPSCTPQQRSAKAKALAKARTAAVVIRATRGSLAATDRMAASEQIMAPLTSSRKRLETQSCGRP